MKALLFLSRLMISVFFSSADPNLFGSRKRRKEKAALANKMFGYAEETQNEIDALKTQNPFETAAAKSAMTQARRNSQQLQQRFTNMLGANATPEAIVAAQGQTQQAVGATAGDIAVGAEAQKQAQIDSLRGMKANQLGQAAGMQASSINERGSGWKDFFGSLNAIGDTIGAVAGGAKDVASLLG